MTQPSQPASPPPSKPVREWIPVANIKMLDREPVELPGCGGKSSVTGSAQDAVIDSTGRRKPGRHWVINFSPSLRHFQIVYYPPEVQMPAVRRMIHEVHVRSWEPLE